MDNNGKGFYFYNVHLDHVSQSSREKSAVLIAERIKNRKHPEDMFILTGDFNAAETNPAVLYLKGEMDVEGSKNPIPPLWLLHPIPQPEIRIAIQSNEINPPH